MTAAVAHMNWGELRHPFDDHRSSGFTGSTRRVNFIAERTEGFVWRQDMDAFEAEKSAIADLAPDDVLVSSLSVWDSAEALKSFVKDSMHGQFVKRRDEWFVAQSRPVYVIWPVARDHRPTLAEGRARLDDLTRDGASPEAYDFAYLAQTQEATS